MANLTKSTTLPNNHKVKYEKISSQETSPTEKTGSFRICNSNGESKAVRTGSTKKEEMTPEETCIHDDSRNWYPADPKELITPVETIAFLKEAVRHTKETRNKLLDESRRLDTQIKIYTSSLVGLQTALTLLSREELKKEMAEVDEAQMVRDVERQS